MGIKNLTQLILKKSPNSIQTAGIYTLKDKKIAIDTSILIYKSLTNVRYNNEYLKNKEGKIVSHIIGLFNKTIQFLSVGIEPIYIFDGKPPKEKTEIICERNKKATNSIVLMHQTNNLQEKNKLEKSSIRIKKEYIDDLKQLFNFMGVSYIHPNCEAETYAAHLCKQNKVHAVYSEDMDTLAFGSPLLIRTCIDRSIKRKDAISIFNLNQILSDFNMDYPQFVDMCILCGCDYCPTIPKIGNIRAFQYIQQYKSIESLLESHKSPVNDDFIQKYKKARKLFLDYSFDEESNIHKSLYNKEALSNYLIHNCCMSHNRVQNALKKIK